MKIEREAITGAGWILALAVLLFPAAAAYGQDDRLPRAALGGLLMFFVFFGLAFYVYLSLALQTIAEKTKTENAWLAWIPIANLILTLNIARKPLWWFLLFLIPVANIVVLVIVWMAVAEARGKPSWWGILMIIPVANLIVPAYLAWSD